MADNPDRTLHFSDYFRVIRNRAWVIFTIFVLTVVSGTYITLYVLPKVYSASAQIQIQPKGGHLTPTFLEGATQKQFDSVDFQAEFTIMQSRDFLMPIITDLNLDHIWAKRVFKYGGDSIPPSVAIDYMSKILKIDFKRGTDIVEVAAESEVPKEAASIANAVIDRYKAVRDVDDAEKANRGSDSLRDQIAQQKKVVDALRANVEKMRVDGKLDLSLGNNAQSTHIEADLEGRKRDLMQAKEDADARRVLLEHVQNLPDDEFVNTLDALGRAVQSITSVRSQMLGMQGDLDNLLKQGFEENHPRVQALQAEIARKQQQIKELIVGARQAIVVDSEMSKSRVDLLQKEVDTLTQQSISDQSTLLAPYRDALRELEKQQSVLDAYTIRLKQLNVDSSVVDSSVRIITRAQVPITPSKPNKIINVAISIVAGLFLGLMVAFLIDYLDTSVKTMADAEQLLGLPMLTVIPNKGGPLPLTQQSARLPHAEGYRILRAKLDLKVQNGLGPSLSMLSGGPGEGKSTTLYNLAVVCAQAGQSVILVDCDLRRPTVHDLLHLSNDHGVADYFRGEGDAVEYIQQTTLPKLHVLTAGDMPMAEIGTLSSEKMRQMLDDLKQRYDLVLVDSPPVLGISDGSIIAREVDYVILVIQHRRYPREISLRAKRAIGEVNGNCIGMVLNSVAVKSDDSYYYYSNYANYYKKADRKKKDGGKSKQNGHSELAAIRHESDREEF